MRFSFSAERCFRRCQRQYFFRELAAWHNARDPLRREAFILKQVKSIELWRGLLVHAGIERFVVPALQANAPVDWDRATGATLDLLQRQLAFSARRLYREKGLRKGANAEDYCALLPHEDGREVSLAELATVEMAIRRSFANLAALDDFWTEVRGRSRYWAELPVSIYYDGARIEVRIDLMYFRSYGKPTIIDWKVYGGNSGSDADVQMALYAWTLCRHPSWSAIRAEDVELLEVRPLQPEVIRHRCDRATLEALEDRLYRGINEIRALVGDGGYASSDLENFAYANSGTTCVFCPFRSLCQGKPFVQEPARKQGINLELPFAQLV